MEYLKADSFFNLNKLISQSLFTDLKYVWLALEKLSDFINDIIKPQGTHLRRYGDLLPKACAVFSGEVFWDEITYQLGSPSKGELKVFQNGKLLPKAALLMPGVVVVSDRVEIKEGALIESGAYLNGPTIIGVNTEVRHGAYVRGQVMTEENVIIGHVTEAKNVLMLPEAKAGHFAYLGDSILGRNVNLGAGTKLANLKIMDKPIKIKIKDGKVIEVNLRKFGAVLGDDCSLGCNSVTNPGVMMAPNGRVRANHSVKSGYYPAKSYFK